VCSIVHHDDVGEELAPQVAHEALDDVPQVTLDEATHGALDAATADTLVDPQDGVAAKVDAGALLDTAGAPCIANCKTLIEMGGTDPEAALALVRVRREACNWTREDSQVNFMPPPPGNVVIGDGETAVAFPI
jgi:hypothetical protein